MITNVDALGCILYDSDVLVTRQVCREWRAIVDDALRARWNDELSAYFNAMRIRFAPKKIPMRYFIERATRVDRDTPSPRYKCGRCKQEVEAIGMCKRCGDHITLKVGMKKAFTGPALVVLSLCITWYASQSKARR
jgi:DNA-directed RNA polymerase subunit RPC12/RpoP